MPPISRKDGPMTQGTTLYLNLLKKVLTNVIYEDPPQGPHRYSGAPFDSLARAEGKDWPSTAHTMVGLKRLDNIEECMTRVLDDGVPGDFIETGVWRGGVCIFMRAVLLAQGVDDRTVWLADSFQGMPDTSGDGHDGDREMALHRHNDVLAVSVEQVRENFRRYDLLDEQVEFLPGWFRDTLPSAPIDRLAVIRLDGDLYESTMDALVHLYPKLSAGGYVIVDDYSIPLCRDAVHDYRTKFDIEDALVPIDGDSVYWRRTR